MSEKKNSPGVQFSFEAGISDALRHEKKSPKGRSATLSAFLFLLQFLLALINSQLNPLKHSVYSIIVKLAEREGFEPTLPLG